MKFDKSRFFLYSVAFMGLIIATTAIFILPERFFYDTVIFIQDPYHEIGFKGSYPLTISFYKYTGLKYLHFSIIGFLQYTICFLILLKAGIPDKFYLANFKNVVIYLAIILLGVFLSMPSKEFITYLFIAVITFLFYKKKYPLTRTIVISVVLFVVFSYWYRPYFVLIPIIAVTVHLLSRLNLSKHSFRVFFYGLGITVFLFLSAGIVKGTYFQMEKGTYNVERIANGEPANSAVIPPIVENTWYAEVVGIFHGFLKINFPVTDMYRLGSPQIFAFVIWQLILLVVLIRKIDVLSKNKNENIYGLWLCYITVAYFIVQGVFEPDLGSAIRHKIGVLPLIYCSLYYNQLYKKKEFEHTTTDVE